MAVHLPPNPTPYTGNLRSDDGAAGRADDSTQAGSVRRSGAAEPTEAGGGLHPAQPLGGTANTLFGTGGQVPLESPPSGPADPFTSKRLADKFRSVVSGGGQPPGEPDGAGQAAGEPDSVESATEPSGGGKFSIDAVLHLLLSVSVDEFKESQKQAQEDVEEKISQLDTSAKDMQDAAKDRLTGAIIQGAGAAVVGLVGTAAAGFSLRSTLAANTKIDAMTNLDVNTKGAEFTRLTARSTGMASTAQGLGQAMQGGGGIWQGEEDARAADSDAAKAEADKAAADDDALHEVAVGMKQEYQSVMQDFLDKEKGLEQSQDQTMMTLARSV